MTLREPFERLVTFDAAAERRIRGFVRWRLRGQPRRGRLVSTTRLTMIALGGSAPVASTVAEASAAGWPRMPRATRSCPRPRSILVRYMLLTCRHRSSRTSFCTKFCGPSGSFLADRACFGGLQHVAGSGCSLNCDRHLLELFVVNQHLDVDDRRTSRCNLLLRTRARRLRTDASGPARRRCADCLPCWLELRRRRRRRPPAAARSAGSWRLSITFTRFGTVRISHALHDRPRSTPVSLTLCPLARPGAAQRAQPGRCA